MILSTDSMDQIENIKEEVQSVDSDKLHEYLDHAVDWIVSKGILLLLTMLFLFIGSKLVKFVLSFIRRSFDKSGVSQSVSGFLISLTRIVLYAVLFITAASLLGFQVTSLVTILGSASIAVGLALQGSLSNLAGGVLILILKPFVVGDYIMENDKKCEGTVQSIEIFYTRLLTPDHKIVVIPNGSLSATSITNLTAVKTRRVELSVGIAYDSDIKKAKDVLKQVAEACPYLDETQNISIFVSEFGDSAIHMGLWFFVSTENFWAAKWETNEAIKHAFDKAGIEIPFNQMDVTIKETVQTGR